VVRTDTVPRGIQHSRKRAPQMEKKKERGAEPGVLRSVWNGKTESIAPRTVKIPLFPTGEGRGDLLHFAKSPFARKRKQSYWTRLSSVLNGTEERKVISADERSQFHSGPLRRT